MSDFPRWRRYLRFARPNVALDVDEELQFHIAMRIERNLALGMAPDEARRDALARFGDVALVQHSLLEHDRRKQAAEGRREYLMDFVQDLRFGWRALMRAPGFAVAATLTLALGIGANAAIFSVVNAIVLRPLPYAQPDRLASIGEGSGGEFMALKERLRSFSDIAAYVGQTHPIDDGEEALRVEGAAVTPNLFAMLGVSPMLGRGFTEDEARFNNNAVLVISHQPLATAVRRRARHRRQARDGGRRPFHDRRRHAAGLPFSNQRCAVLAAVRVQSGQRRHALGGWRQELPWTAQTGRHLRPGGRRGAERVADAPPAEPVVGSRAAIPAGCRRGTAPA